MAQETEAVTEQADESTTPPGAQLAGVVSVQEAELNGEVQSRTSGSASRRRTLTTPKPPSSPTSWMTPRLDWKRSDSVSKR